MKTTLVLTITLVLSLLSPSTARASEAVVPPLDVKALKERNELPLSMIESKLNSEQWNMIKSRPCEGYALLSANVTPDGKLSSLRIQKHFPDGRMDSLALQLASTARISVVSIGSHIPPRAEVAIALLGKEKDETLALVFAHQTISGTPTSVSSRNGSNLDYLNFLTLKSVQ